MPSGAPPCPPVRPLRRQPVLQLRYWAEILKIGRPSERALILVSSDPFASGASSPSERFWPIDIARTSGSLRPAGVRSTCRSSVVWWHAGSWPCHQGATNLNLVVDAIGGVFPYVPAWSLDRPIGSDLGVGVVTRRSGLLLFGRRGAGTVDEYFISVKWDDRSSILVGLLTILQRICAILVMIVTASWACW